MTIWNVSPIYYGDYKVRYTVLPYNLKGTVSSYLKYDKIRRLITFILNSRLSEKSARKYAERLEMGKNKKIYTLGKLCGIKSRDKPST